MFSLVAWIRNRIPGPEGAFQLTMLTACVGLELLRIQIARTFSRQELLFSLYDASDELSLVPVALVCGATVMGVGLTIKVWNNTRNEWKIENQQRLLSEARLMNLTRQMNPHFLFNTLNSVGPSLARTDPDKAREMIYRLSTILRRLLRKQEAFVPLSEEISVIDDYLQIEQVRFAGRLQIEKSIDKESRDALVPSMILQPIVENSIKHGIEPKVGTGTVRLGSSLKSGRLQIEIEDDGVGIPHADMASLFQKGIGLGNARERLEVLFGQDFQLAFEARAGGGVRVRVQIPELRDPARVPESDLGAAEPV